MAAHLVGTEEAMKFALVLARLGSIMAFMPPLDGRQVPARIKASLSLFLALALHPVLAPLLPDLEQSVFQLALAAAKELLFGFAVGLAMRFLFDGFMVAGQLAGFQIGFSLVNAIDPQSMVQASFISTLYGLTATALFMAMGAHRWLIGAVAESFSIAPPGKIHITAPFAYSLVELSAWILVVGLQLAAPILAVLIAADVIFGALGRFAAHIQIFLLALPLKVFLGVFVAAMSLGLFPRFVADKLDFALNAVRALMAALVR